MRWAVFISGFGSNLQALLDNKPADTTVALVVSNKAKAFGLERAEKAEVPTLVLPQPMHTQDWDSLSEQLDKLQIDFIFLLGFLKIVPPNFVRHWQNKILNLHPSLLPLYPGLHSIEKSYADGAAMGVTVHWVNEGLDEGEILLQEQLFAAAEPPEKKHSVTLAKAEELIHELEHKLVIEAVRLCQKKHVS